MNVEQLLRDRRDPQFQAIAVFGTDRRKSEDEFAASIGADAEGIRAKLSATGKLKCGKSDASAQLTLKQNIISTSGHVFRDPKDCRDLYKANQCVFTYDFAGVKRSRRVAKLFENGLKCPQRDNLESDWAVAFLDTPAIGPTPYRIDPARATQLRENENIIQVEPHSADYCAKDRSGACVVNQQGHFIHSRSVQICQVKTVYNNVVATNCAAGGATSGSSTLLLDLTYPTLLGVISGSSATDVEKARELRTGMPIVKEYDQDKWYLVTVPVAGKFAKALSDASSLQ